MPNTVILECIDGKDDHFKISIEDGSSISLGNHPSDTNVFIKELESESGYLLISNNNGLLQVDANNLSTAIKINGSTVTP